MSASNSLNALNGSNHSAPLSDLERAARWSLWSVEGIGPVRMQRIQALCAGHTARLWDDKLLRAGVLAEIKLSSRQRALVDAVLMHPCVAQYELQLAKLTWHERVLHWSDDHYPERLRACDDAPLFLYVSGNPEALAGACLGLVGSREPGAQDAKWARGLSARLANGYDVCVLSGGARGMDTQAHLGALDVQGCTVAVMPAGLHCLTPASNRALFGRIVEQGGALISEYPLDVPAKRYHFPRRNRLIVALSDGILVLEARQKGGTMLTARAALAHGVRVCVVPYHPGASHAAGSLELLSDQHAVLVRSAADVMTQCYGEATPLTPEPAQASLFAPIPTFSCPIQQRVWEACGQVACVEDLAHDLDLTVGKVLSALTLMELAGQIKRVGAGQFSQAAP